MKTLLLTNKLFTIKLQINLDVEINNPFAVLFLFAVFIRFFWDAMRFQMIFVVQNVALPFGDFFFFTDPNLFGHLIDESEVVAHQNLCEKRSKNGEKVALKWKIQGC